MIVRSVLAMVSLVLTALASCAWAAPDKPRVLVVMSYEENNPWVMEMRDGIQSVLGSSSDLTYFYMDTKKDPANGAEKGRQAYDVFQRLQPDGVITMDDDAQSMFVVPYLKDKVATPVIFGGVNAEAEKYGFPNPHVSGVLERAHLRESIAFIKQLIPSVERVAVLVKDSAPGNALRAQIGKEKDGYSARISTFHAVKTKAELLAVARELPRSADALYVDSLEGIVDDDQHALNNKEVFDVLMSAYRGPIIGANGYHVDQGALCAVVKTGNEQGELAAGLLQRALQGTPVSSLALTRNTQGRRVINATTLSRLGIQPKPLTLKGVALVKTQ